MSSVMQRQRSRRRLAAVTFLSNISLDGTHRDTKLAHYTLPTTRNKFLQGSFIINTESKENNKGKELQSLRVKSDSSNLAADNKSLQKLQVQSTEATVDSDVKSSSQVSLNIRERPESMRRPGQAKKKSTHIIPSDKVSCFSSSSNESLATLGLGTRTRKLSSTWSEVSAPHSKEPKFVKMKPTTRVRDERLVLISEGKFPFHIFSTIRHDTKMSRLDVCVKDGVRRRQISGTRPLSTISDSTDLAHVLGLVCFEESVETSYSDLLVPSRNFAKPKRQPDQFLEKDRVGSHHPGIARCYSYEPSTHKTTAHYVPHNIPALPEREETCPFTNSHEIQLVDDPELQAGKHRKLLRFPSYLTSTIDYTKASELKKELNDKFKQKFPHIKLTLSKLRSLKREMLKIARQECELDLLTVAQSYAYLERVLVIRNVVNKQTRKLVCGACLILSAKLNDVKGDALCNLLEKTENAFRLNRKELLQWEVAVLVLMEFGLHLPTWKIMPHYQRLLSDS